LYQWKFFFPFAAFCASLQIKWLIKWRKFLTYYKGSNREYSLGVSFFSDKKNRVLYGKIRDENITKYKDVIEFYWSNNGKCKEIKDTNYDKYKYIET